MTKDQRKLRILRHAEEIGHVAGTCRYFGIGRSSFYRWRQDVLRSAQREAIINKRDVPRVTAPYTLQQAVLQRQPGSGLVLHSDRGSQYLSIRYTERLAEAGVEPSVGSVCDSYDNALAETANGLFNAEVIHRRGPWRSFDAVEYATLYWVNWFNNRRLFEPIVYIPPREVEANYYATLETSDMAA